MSRDDDEPLSQIDEELQRAYEIELDDPSMGPIDWLFAAVGFIAAAFWLLIRFAIPILILVAIVGAATGIFDKEEVREDRNNPGWEMVRDLRDSGDIEEFKAVEPDEGWEWQYELDSFSDLRFRMDGPGVAMEYETSSRSLEEAIGKVAEESGFFERE